jgi:hypothetical protein
MGAQSASLFWYQANIKEIKPILLPLYGNYLHTVAIFCMGHPL